MEEIWELIQNPNSGKREHSSQQSKKTLGFAALLPLLEKEKCSIPRSSRSEFELSNPCYFYDNGCCICRQVYGSDPECTQFVILQRACSLPEGSPHPEHTAHYCGTTEEKGFLHSQPNLGFRNAFC